MHAERVIIEPFSEKLFEDSFLFPVLLEVTEQGLFVLDVRNDARVRRIHWDFKVFGNYFTPIHGTMLTMWKWNDPMPV